MELRHTSGGFIPFWTVAIRHCNTGFELQRGRVKDVPGSGQGHSGSRPLVGSSWRRAGGRARKWGWKKVDDYE